MTMLPQSAVLVSTFAALLLLQLCGYASAFVFLKPPYVPYPQESDYLLPCLSASPRFTISIPSAFYDYVSSNSIELMILLHIVIHPNGNMYVQLPGTFTFAEALVEAAKEKYVVNGTVPHLLTVESASEGLFIFQYYYTYVWIGAQDVGTPQNHDFRFATGPSIGQELKYFGGWMRGQPDSSGNTCIMVQYNVREQIEPEWALVPCGLKLWIVLEYEGLLI